MFHKNKTEGSERRHWRRDGVEDIFLLVLAGVIVITTLVFAVSDIRTLLVEKSFFGRLRHMDNPSGAVESETTLSLGDDWQDRVNASSTDKVYKATTTSRSSKLFSSLVRGFVATSSRTISTTNELRHSIPLAELSYEIRPQNSMPPIDHPVFISSTLAEEFLNENSRGIGVVFGEEEYFYPLSILAWHAVVNSSAQGTPVLVTYDPLSGSGAVFYRTLGTVTYSFGVSERRWQSNLLFYNRPSEGIFPRTNSYDLTYGLDIFSLNESLWSQVLGEAVIGKHTGTMLTKTPSDIVRWGVWKLLHPKTKVLSQDTGYFRDYARDPYEDYYETRDIYFPTSFKATTVHPKEFVCSIIINDQQKAYQYDRISVGITKDTFAGHEVTITRNIAGEVRFKIDDEMTQTKNPVFCGFWFVWQAVYPNTALL